MTNAIELRGMTVRRGAVTAVRSVSFDVPAQTWFGIIGANGSGKTSLLRGIAGRLPCTIDSCLINGLEVAAQRKDRAERLGFMVPAEQLPGPLTCDQVFALIEPDRAVWHSRLGGVWDALGIDRLVARRIANCSAGMRQRISLAAAFLTSSRIVILDEPFNWLDPVAANDLRDALRTQVDSGTTLITALHDMISLAACDLGILLGRGEIIETIDGDGIDDGRNSPFEFEQRITNILRVHTVLD